MGRRVLMVPSAVSHLALLCCPGCGRFDTAGVYPIGPNGDVDCLNTWHLDAPVCLCGRVFHTRFGLRLHDLLAGPMP